MKRFLTLAAIAAFATGAIAPMSAEAAFFGTRATRSTATTEPANTRGLRADQLKFGSKAWVEQMEREGRFGGRRG